MVTTLACYLMLTYVHSAPRIRENEKALINTGFDAGLQIADFVKLLGDPKTSKFFKKVGQMAKFLGAAGGYVSLILTFIPSGESEEMMHMKTQFALVNTKLDKVTSELNKVEGLIKYENQRAAYLSSAHAILYGHKQLFGFFDEVQRTNCSNVMCPRIRSRIAQRYITSLDVKLHLDKILHGTARKTSVFGDQLLLVVKDAFQCDFSKIIQFTNGVLKLAFKGQQVILAYEKLTGSKHSVTRSVIDWLKNIYELRSFSLKVKHQCFRNIKTQLIHDIQKSDYQIGSSTNAIANAKVKQFLEEKYPRMEIVAFSYKAYGANEHCTANTYGPFWSMPSSKESRKRTLIVNFIDKNGAYFQQKYRVMDALDRIVQHTDFSAERRSYCKVLDKIKREMKNIGVWRWVLTATVAKSLSGFAIKGGNNKQIVRRRYSLYFRYGAKGMRRGPRHKLTVDIVIILKSNEQAGEKGCILQCQNNGQCRKYPYSGWQYCECKPFYQGQHCEEYSETELAKTIDAMMEVTFKLPVLTDISFGISDLRDFVGASFVNMQRGISLLEAGIQSKFDRLSSSIANGFKWARLVSQYARYIQTIEYFSHCFEELPKEYNDKKKLEEAGKRLAEEVLHVSRGIGKALFYLNQLFVGKKSKPLLSHRPLLLVFMEQKGLSGEPCNQKYKQAIDNYRRKLILLQQIGYMVWAQALAFAGKKSAIVSNIYRMRLKLQEDTIKNATCQYVINNSLNVQCEGHYLHPGMALINRCKNNYFVTGSFKTSCIAKTSNCSRCQCYQPGSVTMQCENISGKCRCKELFYGLGCTNRDCVWGNWSSYGLCSSCGYGAIKNRTREVNVTALGDGITCKGAHISNSTCFIGCCKNQFHCKKTKKCIQGSFKCNYDNNCGDRTDELNCKERCKTYYTWPPFYIGYPDGVYNLYNKRPKCKTGSVLKAFGLQKLHGRKKVRVRYRYICCKLNKNICHNRGKYSKFTNADITTSTKRLSELTVECPGLSYLSSFALQPNKGLTKMRYSYECCMLLSANHKRRSRCYTDFTAWTGDGRGNVLYLDSQYVNCRPRYFLNHFRLERKGGWWFVKGHIRYRYRCCRVYLQLN